MMPHPHKSLPLPGGFRTTRGLMYPLPSGIIIRCYQLTKQDGYAYAVADFDGPTLKRFMTSDSIAKESDAWVKSLMKEVKRL